MELRHLRYFLAVAEEGHVTRAAERLGIQQPPLSQQIRALEDELGVQLFRRKPRGVELTDAGRSLLADAQVILAQVERAQAKVARTARGEQGTLVVGFTSSAPFHPFVPRIIKQFRDAYPGVTLTLEELGTIELVAGLRAEEIDAAFIRSPVADREGIAVHALLVEPMVVALPDDHPLAAAGDAPLAIADLASEPFLLYRRASGPGFYDAILSACHRAGFTPHVVQEAPRIVATLNLVAAGLGISLVPQSLGQLAMAGVAWRPLAEASGLAAPLNLACRTVDHSTPARHFVTMVRRSAKAPEEASQ